MGRGAEPSPTAEEGEHTSQDTDEAHTEAFVESSFGSTVGRSIRAEHKDAATVDEESEPLVVTGLPVHSVERIQLDPFEIASNVKAAFDRVNQQIIGREEILKQTLYAMLTREHHMIFSRAGTGKSLYAGAVFEQFSSSDVFKIQLTKGTTEEGVVGGIVIDELKRGNTIHNTEGSLVEADFGFLDEIFDANDVTLRAMLGILNERRFRKGKQLQDANLHMAIATSNYVRNNEVTEAVNDRFVFRSKIVPTYDPFEMIQIDKTYERNVGEIERTKEEEKVPLEHVQMLADVIEGRHPDFRVTAPSSILFLKNLVITEFASQINEQRKAEGKAELYISPRTYAKARDVLNAAAVLAGRDEIKLADIQQLKYMVCVIGDEEKQEEVFEKAVQKVGKEIGRAGLKQVELLMQANEISDRLVQGIETGLEFERSFLDKVKMFLGFETESSLTFLDLKRAIDKVRPTHPAITQLKIGILNKIDADQGRLEMRDDERIA